MAAMSRFWIGHGLRPVEAMGSLLRSRRATRRPLRRTPSGCNGRSSTNLQPIICWVGDGCSGMGLVLRLGDVGVDRRSGPTGEEPGRRPARQRRHDNADAAR